MGCVSSGPKAVYEPDVVAKAAAPPTATDVMTPRSIPKAPPITSTGLNQESVARSIVGNIKFTGLIGVGGYGRVYRAKWNGGDVAVKVVPRASWNEEANLSQQLRHPNVVSTFIYTNNTAVSKLDDENEETSVIVMEFCDKGGLKAAIEEKVFLEKANPIISWMIMTLKDIAAGVAYLHEIGVLHGDLKTDNVLLCSKSTDVRGFMAKVADFGMSRVFHSWGTTHKSTTVYGTITHVPPELLADGKLSPKTDTYAFGIMMHELYTGLKPFENCHYGQVVASVIKGDRPVFPSTCPVQYSHLAQACWKADKNERPEWSEIFVALNALQELYPE